MSLITLISDWGINDYYTAAVKGMIYKHHPKAEIVDITHEIEPFNVNKAAYILKNSYQSFPEGTIHIIGINTEESLNHPHVVAYYDKHYFIGTDNGVLSLIFDREPEKLFVLDILQDSPNFTFSGRDRFVKAAVHLAKGGKPEELGNEKTKLANKLSFKPAVNKDSIRGMVIHIDTYENLITNIPEDLFRDKVKNKKFTISLRSTQINKIHDSYGDVPNGEIVAIFASNGMLEIAMNKGNAASLLGVNEQDPILIEIK
jgi:S-adenosylmethionine hydrolase